jgi:myosin heavy subunit
LAQFLLKSGANSYLAVNEGGSALDFARTKDNAAVVQIIADHAVAVQHLEDIQVDIRDGCSQSALGVSAKGLLLAAQWDAGELRHKLKIQHQEQATLEEMLRGAMEAHEKLLLQLQEIKAMKPQEAVSDMPRVKEQLQKALQLKVAAVKELRKVQEQASKDMERMQERYEKEKQQMREQSRAEKEIRKREARSDKVEKQRQAEEQAEAEKLRLEEGKQAQHHLEFQVQRLQEELRAAKTLAAAPWTSQLPGLEDLELGELKEAIRAVDSRRQRADARREMEQEQEAREACEICFERPNDMTFQWYILCLCAFVACAEC